MDQETALHDIVALVRGEHRQAVRELIEREIARLAAGDGPRALRFLEDLDFFVRMRGPDFIYSRGVAGSLRVSEDVFELAYAVRRKMP
ncbi:MAG: hypothetical protein HQK81_07565 [Desulfovibrionaceae bacterium]|nr:hypothetical protein [Desulfovibrionaceae bacterium]MBF0513907.1 hypothetical protein [Desulfovibrionaceae bacterium]